jgi:hypothetical protein
MRIFTTILSVCLLCSIKLRAETLNDLILSKLQADEQLWSKAINGTDGHQLELLRSSKFYVPFFMELPSISSSLSDRNASLFGDWKKLEDKFLLPGGYILRLKFKSAAPLYAMSAGYWNDDVWRSIALGKDFQIEPGNAWEGSTGDCLYATLLAGVRPRLISYNQSGEVIRQETFDASAADFEQRLNAAIAAYASSGKPSLEMISLVEYLKQPNAEWRAVDTTGQFNLRNQHQRADEQERLRQVGQLTRGEAVSGLSTNAATTTQTTPAPKPPPVVQSGVPKKSPEAKPTTSTPSEEPASSTPWSIIVVLIVAAFGLPWLLLKRRS